ncbi:hypothetical protein [Novosphingobium cyanobacteriorum]|uniref:Uncharacterized protein n=1 Tax=Novosphingobium cyanobacteriorum TaxID=3024215 RepID=A0ABT6CMU6_9SPHN|nr:hypothetical protein [Novosphingobium cyanobacteriorum]MDF8335245.1 hypothetical protein [Novosphingobium cyanobacteriorum]
MIPGSLLILAAATAAADPINTARTFAELLATDRAAAAAMVALDAQMGFGDVGAPFDMAVFADGFAQCRFAVRAGAQAKPLGMAGRAIDTVPLIMACPDEHGTVREREAQLLVEGERVAGFYVP